MYLSKSKYTRALQCPKMLWMDTYMPEKAEQDDGVEARFETGNKVGDLARGYFGDYTLVEYSEDKSLMIEATLKYIDAGEENIAEASFSYNGNFCSVDILHKTPYGWEIYEVKSSRSVKPVHLDDMAFQCYVLKNCGLNVTGVYLMHINNQYALHGDLDLKQYFTAEDCTDEVAARLPYIEQNIQQIEQFFARTEDFEPEYDIGPHCDYPYGCDYKSYCFRNLPSPNIFDIYKSLGRKSAYDWYYEGIVSFEDIVKRAKDFPEKPFQQVEFTYYNKPPYVDKKALKEFLGKLTYPLYYLDFETYTQTIPKIEGTTTKTVITFQYSLHIQHEKGAECEHREFLGKEGTDTRRAVAERLCKDIPEDICVFAYWSTFEKTRIKELADLFPDLAPHLLKIRANIIDLYEPFKNGWYYCEAQHGSNSIKQVLPALCTNDPELDYHNLDEIHNGGEASSSFEELHTKSPEEIARTRENLLKYCELDTLAMVKILEKLYEICE